MEEMMNSDWASNRPHKAVQYPRFSSVNHAFCFNCGGHVMPSTIKQSGYPVGRYVGACGTCNLKTWFDVNARQTQR
jgi:hypothetical protein